MASAHDDASAYVALASFVVHHSHNHVTYAYAPLAFVALASFDKASFVVHHSRNHVAYALFDVLHRNNFEFALLILGMVCLAIPHVESVIASDPVDQNGAVPSSYYGSRMNMVALAFVESALALVVALVVASFVALASALASVVALALASASVAASFVVVASALALASVVVLVLVLAGS